MSLRSGQAQGARGVWWLDAAVGSGQEPGARGVSQLDSDVGSVRHKGAWRSDSIAGRPPLDTVCEPGPAAVGPVGLVGDWWACGGRVVLARGAECVVRALRVRCAGRRRWSRFPEPAGERAVVRKKWRVLTQ